MAPFNGTGEMPRTLVIGSIGPRMEAELIAVGVPAGTVDGGGQAVGLLRNGDYDVVVVPTDLTDMSAFDFTTSLLRHIPDVFVILWGGMMDPDKVSSLVQSGRVVHFRGDEDGSVAIWVMEKASGGNPADPGGGEEPATIVGAATPSTPMETLSGLGAPPAASPFGGAPAAGGSPFGGAPAAGGSPFGGGGGLPLGAPVASGTPFGGGGGLPLAAPSGGDPAREQQLEEDLGLAQAELEETQARLQQAEATAQAYAGDLRTALETLEAERAQQAQAGGELDEIRRSLHSAQEFLKTVSQERDGLKALVQSLEEERAGQESGVGTLRADLDEVKVHLLHVQSELSEAQRVRDAATAETAALAAVVAERDVQLGGLHGTLAALENVAADRDRKIAELEAQNAQPATEDPLSALVSGLKPEVALEAAAFLEITGEGEEHVERLREFAAQLSVVVASAKSEP